MHISTMAGASAGARHASAQKRITQRLREKGAVHRDTAQPLPEVSGIERKEMERLIGKDIIRQARPGLYYLDEAALRDHRGTALRVVWVLIVLVAGVAAALALLS
jgi:hypothetical protein